MIAGTLSKERNFTEGIPVSGIPFTVSRIRNVEFVKIQSQP